MTAATTASVPQLGNAAARRLFLDRHGLLRSPSGPGKGDDLLGVIRQLGFVQVDSISTVARAHHMILFARRPAYRQHHLAPLLERDRSLFEHWTHDASIVPIEFHPHWRLRFKRDATRLRQKWRSWQRAGFEDRFQSVLDRIAYHGPCSSADVGTDEPRSSGGWWDWHPSKTALEYLWRAGKLAVTRRENFRKIYDLSARVIPPDIHAERPAPEHSIDWLCNGALDRLGFATPGEIAAFWDIVRPDESRDWAKAALAGGRLIALDVVGHDGARRRMLARPDAIRDAAALPAPTGRLRVLSPFDPLLRDRKRAERLFGFRYRIEIFVPADRRRYGYYVFPLLEGADLVGRIDMKADRDADALHVRALWPEAGVRWGKGRQARLEAELARVARLAEVAEVSFADRWLRTAPPPAP